MASIQSAAADAAHLLRSPTARTSVSTRALRLFGDVRAGETRDTLLLLPNLFVLLVAYYVLKTVREPLILAYGGAGLLRDEYRPAAAVAADHTR